MTQVRQFPKHNPSEYLIPKFISRPNPATSGIRYFLSDHGCSVRASWPLPSTARSKIDQAESSCDGCSKKRPVYIGHKQRSGIWVVLCMVHERVVGFHIMTHSEGRRDALVPIYRFKEEPPIAMWHDFSCGCEESALNWMPEYFTHTQHFHDMFHGYSHKCSLRFSSRRLPAFASLNTSLMEQVSVSTVNPDTTNIRIPPIILPTNSRFYSLTAFYNHSAVL